MKLVLIRHGEISLEVKVEEGLVSLPDPSLTENGHEQIRKACKTLKQHEIRKIFLSSTKRSLQSIEVIIDELGEIPCQVENLINPVGFPRDEQLEQFILEKAKADKPWQELWLEGLPGFENQDHFKKRVLKALNKIRDVHPNDTILWVTHEEIFWVLMTLKNHVTFDIAAKNQIPYGNIAIFDI